MNLLPASTSRNTLLRGGRAILEKKPVRYLMAGAVMSLCGLGLNVFLIEVAQMDRQPAYGIVMVFLVLLGFVANRNFVFLRGETVLSILFFQYLSAVFVFRLCDWFLYALLVEIFEVYYPLAQVASGIVIVTLKYFCYDKLFEKT